MKDNCRIIILLIIIIIIILKRSPFTTRVSVPSVRPAGLKQGGALPSLFNLRRYLRSLKLVEVVRLFQRALSGVSVLAVNIDVDVGVGSRSEHVPCEHAHFVRVLCGRRTTWGLR